MPIPIAASWLGWLSPLQANSPSFETDLQLWNLLRSCRQRLAQFSPVIQGWINDVLVWIGFGTVIGLLSKAVMPGRDPGGAVVTLGLGIGGVIIGCGVWSLFTNGQRVVPVSPLDILIGTAGAFALLFFYRLLGGYWFREGDELAGVNVRRRRRFARRYSY